MKPFLPAGKWIQYYMALMVVGWTVDYLVTNQDSALLLSQFWLISTLTYKE